MFSLNYHMYNLSSFFLKTTLWGSIITSHIPSLTVEKDGDQGAAPER